MYILFKFYVFNFYVEIKNFTKIIKHESVKILLKRLNFERKIKKTENNLFLTKLSNTAGNPLNNF